MKRILPVLFPALSGIDFVRVGVHGRRGEDAYGSSEIARLLRLRDQLGRDTDDPSDGITQKADSMGEGGSNVTFGRGGITSPEKFFPYKGNRFVSGSTTTIQPGQSMLVTMTFRLDERPAPSGVLTRSAVAFLLEAAKRPTRSSL